MFLNVVPDNVAAAVVVEVVFILSHNGVYVKVVITNDVSVNFVVAVVAIFVVVTRNDVITGGFSVINVVTFIIEFLMSLFFNTDYFIWLFCNLFKLFH